MCTRGRGSLCRLRYVCVPMGTRVSVGICVCTCGCACERQSVHVCTGMHIEYECVHMCEYACMHMDVCACGSLCG